jgi:hypothetical protein
LLPSEVAIIDDLEKRKIPLSKIDLNPTKQQDIKLVLQDECIKEPKRKVLAQKVFCLNRTNLSSLNELININPNNYLYDFYIIIVSYYFYYIR